ncbi:hypothetical protein RBH26_15805 [Natronolimnohabitans sp. A-GB9]|nr:hypothetical protein [Natronolimnohabitans sp. A-GB9]MDQ2051943.1 hypothetical protein [Natronolimnohabitans sp. A-GB9]
MTDSTETTDELVDATDAALLETSVRRQSLADADLGTLVDIEREVDRT